MEFFYTGKFECDSFTSMLTMLDTASQLQIGELLELCQEYLIKALDTGNCVSVLRLGETYSLRVVIDACRSFLCANIVDIYSNSYEQFRQLSLDQLRHLIESDSLQVFAEIDLFLIIVKWIESTSPGNFPASSASAPMLPVTAGDHETVDRLKYAPELMKSIRFMCMTAEELADHVEKVDFMKSIPECNAYLIDAYRYHALPKRQPLVVCERTRMRNEDVLIAVGEQSLYVLNEYKQKWDVLCNAPLEDNYREFGRIIYSFIFVLYREL
jgi:hypothetical protein